MSAMFRSFASFNYRTWFAGAVISNIGGWMQATAQDWVVLTELTDNDATAMGVTMALQFGPPLLLVGLTGWVADRFDRRKVLLATQTVLMMLALAVAALLLTGVMTLPLMFCFAAAFGVTNAFDAPARQAFVSDMVSIEDTSTKNFLSLNLVFDFSKNDGQNFFFAVVSRICSPCKCTSQRCTKSDKGHKSTDVF